MASQGVERTAAGRLEHRLSVVIPAFNEAAGITATLRDLGAAMPGAEIIVVDDGSRDGTADAAAEFPCVTVLQHSFNRGYGAALKSGMSVATREFVAWFDADNEHRASDLKAMLEIMAQQRVAAIVAQRRFSGPSPLRGLGKFLIRMLARALDFRGGPDMNCGLRIFRREIITRYAALLPDGFSASITSTMILLEQRYPIAYHAIELNPRIGQSKVKLNDGFTALMLVLRMIMLFAPLRIFIRIGLGLLAIGVSYGVPVAIIAGRGFPTAAALAVVSGLLVGLVGLVADQLSHLRLAEYDRPVFRYRSQPGPLDAVPADAATAPGQPVGAGRHRAP